MNVYIDATRGDGYPGDLAIDDVTITGNSCSELNVINKSK